MKGRQVEERLVVMWHSRMTTSCACHGLFKSRGTGFIPCNNICVGRKSCFSMSILVINGRER
jgi:hypothetical protein